MFETVCVFFLILMNTDTAVSSNVTESTNNTQGDQLTASVATSALENTVIEWSSSSPHQSQSRSTSTAIAKISSMEGIKKSTPIIKTSTSSVQASQTLTSSIETSYPPMSFMTSSAVVTSSTFEELSTSMQAGSDVATAQVTSSHSSAYSVVIVATSPQLSALTKTTQIDLPSQGEFTKETGTMATASLGIPTAIKIGNSATSSEKELESIFSKLRPTSSTSGLATQTTESPKDMVTKASPIALSTQLVPTDETVTTQLPEGPATTPMSTAPDSTSEPGRVEAYTGRKALLVTIYVICAVLFIAVIVLVVVLCRSIRKKRSKNLRTHVSAVSADVEDGNVLTLRAIKNNVSKENLTEELKEDPEESKPLLDSNGVGSEDPNVVQDHDMQSDENSKPGQLLSSEKTGTERNDEN